MLATSPILNEVCMSNLILHQYAMSPFSMKVIKVLAHKGVAWAAVDQPMIAPKPDLTPLTGGYRRIPVLQMGAHIYCDTKLIISQIERTHTDTPLTPAPLQGVADMIADWADHRMFSHAAMPTVFEMMDSLPPEFLTDRAAMQPSGLGAGLSPEHNAGQLVQDCLFIERQLGATPFLLGDAFTLADAAAFHVLNFACNAPKLGAMIKQHAKLEDWRQRIIAMGEGVRSNMSAADALAIARDAQPDETPPANAIDDATLPVGGTVSIKPDDYGQEVTAGEIVWVTADEIAVKRTDDAVGSVMVHYPRVGYAIST